MSDPRTFPVIPEWRRDVPSKPHPLRIPWSVAELAYSVYSARYGTGQTLERLAERGGFHAGEMDDYLPDWRERASDLTAARAEIEQLHQQLATAQAARERAEEELKAKESAAMLGQYMLDTVECLCESGHDRDSPRDKQIDGFISAWQKLKAERDAAFRECAKWAARCGEAEGKLQGSELAGVVRDWQERAEAAESRLAKVGEIIRKTAYTLRNDSGWMSPNMEKFAWKLVDELEAALTPTN